MDPVSAPASILALVSAAIAVSKAVKLLVQSISNAPDELLALFNEVEDLRVVLASIELSLKANGGSEINFESTAILPTVLRRTSDKLQELQLLLAGFCPSATEGVSTLRRLDWSRRGKDKAQKIQQELRSLKWTINTSLGSLAVFSTQRIGLAVESVNLEFQTLRNHVGQATTVFQQQQASTRQAIEEVRQSQDSTARLIETKVEQLRLDTAEHSANIYLAGQLNSLLPPSAVAVQLSVQQRSMCVPSCSCLCHQWRQLRSPRVFDRLIGSLLVGYSGVPLMTVECTVKSCSVKASYAMKVCYRFPAWMLARAVLVSIYSRYGQPTAGLSVVQIRPHSSLVFAFAESGNATGLKHLFDHRLASPYDISAQTGDHPLHITTDHGFVDASRLILSYGGDPHAWDTRHKNTPHTLAWSQIFAKSLPLKERRRMASFFPNPYASNQFNHLHELVLELKYGDLDAELSRENFNIDAQDSDGNSALEWACTRGDYKTVKWLLDHGADVNLANLNNGRTPLMAACARASLPCVELLLNHNADVNVENFWGLDAMIYLCNEDRSPQPVTDIVHAAKTLISRGIKLSPRGVHRVSCLSRAARTQLIPVMELILEQGVDIDLRNQFGSTALSSSVAWSASRSVKFLLDQGASYTEADIDGRTLLHVAALNASIDMVDVLREADLEGLDPDLTDNESHTAEDYVERARELPEAFAPAFRHLLSDLRARYRQEGEDWNTAHGSPEGERESDDEDFLDACEFLESAPEVTSAPVRT